MAALSQSVEDSSDNITYPDPEDPVIVILILDMTPFCLYGLPESNL